MAFEEAKIYYDGGHYIAIPKTDKPTVKRKSGGDSIETMEEKEKFEQAYKKANGKRKREKITEIETELRNEFESEEETKAFVKEQMNRKTRNDIVRKTRLIRKINIGRWNYFCTFTYDDKKHTEESFRRRLSDTFKKLCYRRKWRYIGVWERSKNDRLHFHGLFDVPESGMVGELTERRDYSFVTHDRKKTHENSYFAERFGRNDFSPIAHKDDLAQSAVYLLKYITKTGERIVYSKNTPTYFVSDILDEDVVCTIGQEDRKLLLFDDFSCFDEGVYIGQVCPDVIEQLKKKN